VDTQTQRRGRADTSSSRFAKLLVVSLLLHIPFTPWAALVGLLSLWSPVTDDEPAPPITAIPVDLIEDAPAAPAATAEPTQPESAADNAGPAEPAPKKPKPKPEPEKAHDAGAPGAGEPDAEANDAGTSATDAGPKRVETDAGASTDAGPPNDAGARPIVDPVLVGSVKQVVDSGAPIKIWIYTDKVRGTAVGARLGPLLRSLYQWRDFFGPTSIDPVRDIDQIVINASQLRDSSNVVAILKHHVSPDRMRAAVDGLVRADHTGGMWLDAGVPAASAHADGAERRFILANATTVIVTPPASYAAALAAAKIAHLIPGKGPEAAIVYLATPWHAFVGLPVQVPHSIKWARFRITPTPDGGATAELEAEDENEGRARDDADYLTRTANALSQLNLGFLGSLLGQQSHKFIEHVAFSSDGKMIHGDAQITAAQLDTVLDLAGAFLADRATRQERARTPAAPPATAQ
jgi:hypothetical protein